MAVELRGRTAIVTGSSKGIGYAIAEALARADANVVVSARNPAEVTEAEYPVECLAYELMRDREGAGKYRGGTSFRRDYRFLEAEGRHRDVVPIPQPGEFTVDLGQPGAARRHSPAAHPGAHRAASPGVGAAPMIAQP